MGYRLKHDQLRAVCEPVTLPFASTAELPALDGVIGQDRAVVATTFGVGMRDGYNLFVLGPARTGKTSTMKRILARAAESEPVPAEYCYVHNFQDPYRPIALILPAGRGRELREEMDRLVDECKLRLQRAFESEAFERQKSQILEELNRGQQAEIERFESAARAEKFAVIQGPGGWAVAPAPQGEPLTTAEYDALPEAEKQQIQTRGEMLHQRLDAALHEMRRLERQARQAHEKLVRDVAATAVHELIQELREQFAGLSAVAQYLDAVEHDLVAHAEEFKSLGEAKPSVPFMRAEGGFLDRYRVNVLVDMSRVRGAPVVFEPNPTYGNLVGRVEHRVHFGTLMTDFTQIKAGALHRANGGYLLLEAEDVLRNPLAWDALKKALKARAIRIEDPLEEWRFASAAGLAPEPIPLSVKVVLIGSPLIYYLLCAFDEDFRELFKVKVDFDDSLPRTPEFEMLYARFVAGACREESLPHFSPGGVATLIEHCSRLVADQRRLSSRLGDVLDLIRESAFWARQRKHELVQNDDVRHAIAQKIYRENLLEERTQRVISEGMLLIATDGAAIGQVNGMAVLSLGDHAFGRPSRITARTFAGAPGVIDIEREAKLGGPIHSKGVMILSGFVAGRYARAHPLALSASIAFEQHYEEVEGDSASSAELYALLSSLAGIPLDQSVAVTGSVNQLGEIQPVGGINEKIEGFFDVCRARGLTGRQGVLIPEANARHLMLREDVVTAVKDERFFVHTVSTVDEGLALLSGREAGERGPDGRFPDGSFNATVEEALAANVRRLKELRAGSGISAREPN
ncbi:MAG TPA: ATP-binding protein [Candidatus Methylomirabilis sp.]|nr:ATP-binding protein [Candidatus Methylomirabilis sp.]